MMRFTTRPLHYHHLMAFGLAFFAFAMSALVSRTVFERLPHLEDEMAYLFQAKIFERGHLVVDTPDPRRAYWQPFVMDYEPTGKRFGKYTPGWPAVLAVGINLGQAWVVNAFLAALTVALTYRLGREIFNADVGVVGAGLTAFSPMALLLNGTLMGHTEALFFTTLFMYAYWRTSRRHWHTVQRTAQRRLFWGALAGFALGMVVISRPLTGVAVAVPFVVWSGLQLLKILIRGAKSKALPDFLAALRPLLALGVTALLVSSAIPIFNYAATGNPRQNLYLLQWEYDQIGFGKCCGRNGHTLEKGIRQTRWDMTLAAADLFGWQTGSIDESVVKHLQEKSDDYPNTGLSWLILPLALLVGFRGRRVMIAAWLILGGVLFQQTLEIPRFLAESPFLSSLWNTLGLPSDPLHTPSFAWLWMGIAMAWVLSPAVFLVWFGGQSHSATSEQADFSQEQTQMDWTWLLTAVVLCLIVAHVTYWIGSQRYSTRYYFEGLSAIALVCALPIVWLMHRWKRWPVYVIFGVVLIYTLYAYSTPRIAALYRYNFIGADVIAEVKQRAQADKPVLVLVTGDREDNDVRWRATASLMAVTSPYLDSPIVVAWDFAPGDPTQNVREKILARFPDRQVIEMSAQVNQAWFVD